MTNKDKADRIVDEIKEGRKYGVDLFLPVDTYNAQDSAYELWVSNPCQEIIIVTASFKSPFYGLKLSEKVLRNPTTRFERTDNFNEIVQNILALLDMLR